MYVLETNVLFFRHLEGRANDVETIGRYGGSIELYSKRVVSCLNPENYKKKSKRRISYDLCRTGKSERRKERF